MSNPAAHFETALERWLPLLCAILLSTQSGLLAWVGVPWWLLVVFVVVIVVAVGIQLEYELQHGVLDLDDCSHEYRFVAGWAATDEGSKQLVVCTECEERALVSDENDVLDL